MKKIYIVAAVALVVAVACKSKKEVVAVAVDPGVAAVKRGETKFPGYTAAMYAEGKTINETYCGGCHSINHPDSESEEAWKKIVPNMVKKTNRKAGSTVITPEKEEVLLKYLLASKTN